MKATPLADQWIGISISESPDMEVFRTRFLSEDLSSVMEWLSIANSWRNGRSRACG